MTSPALFVSLCFLTSAARAGDLPKVEGAFFGIQVVDEATGRGVPLVELRTVNDLRLVTDNAGWIAFQEPGMMDREVYWQVSGPGIEREKDGFGFACFRAVTKPGTTAQVKVKSTNVAVRLGRLTGQGLYRDSELLGLPHPLANLTEAGVTGQDSVQAVPWQGKIFWLWGDTNVAQYQLGNYQTTSALTAGDAHPERGLTFEYFMDTQQPGQLRHMLPSTEPGAVWMFGLLSVKDPQGRERLFSGYSRQRGLVPPDEKGIAEFDETSGVFRPATVVSKDALWQTPAGQAVRVKTAEGDHFYFCTPYANTRVAAEPSSILDPNAYERCCYDKATHQWQWQRTLPPTTAEEETKLLKSGTMPATQARHQLTDAATGTPIKLHGASIQWNAWRKKFVLIGVQISSEEKPSALGEVWYAESATLEGPWIKAVKIASHPRYSYYNPIHHAFFDREGGRVIYFEGTYTLQFSSNPLGTQRYDYNQLMYRLELDHPALQAAREPQAVR